MMGTSTPNPLPCGCRAALSRETLLFPGTWHVQQCAIHQAAEAALAACRALLAWNDQYGDDTTCLDAAVSLASRAVTAAEPPAPKEG